MSHVESNDYLYRSNIGIVILRVKKGLDIGQVDINVQTDMDVTLFSKYIKKFVYPNRSKKTIIKMLLSEFGVYIKQVLRDKLMHLNEDTINNHKLQISYISEDIVMFTYLHVDLFANASIRQIKHEFVETVNADLRSFLTEIIDQTKLLGKNNAQNSDIQNYVDTIQICVSNIITIINDIIDFNKLETDTMSLNMATFDVKKVVTECTSAFKNIDFTIEWNHLARFIIADKHRFCQVFNACLNQMNKAKNSKMTIIFNRTPFSTVITKELHAGVQKLTSRHDLCYSADEIKKLHKESKLDPFTLYIEFIPSNEPMCNLKTISVCDYTEIKDQSDMVIAQQLAVNMGGNICVKIPDSGSTSFVNRMQLLLSLCVYEWDHIDTDLKAEFENKFAGKTCLMIESSRSRQLELAAILIHMGFEILTAIDLKEAKFYLEHKSRIHIIFCSTNFTMSSIKRRKSEPTSNSLQPMAENDSLLCDLFKLGKKIPIIGISTKSSVRRNKKYQDVITYPYKVREIYSICLDVLGTTNRVDKDKVLDICIMQMADKYDDLIAVCKQTYHCNISVVHTKSEVISIVKKQIFDMIFLDIDEKSSTQLVKYIKTNIKQVVVVGMLKEKDLNLEKYYKLGLDAYIDIPINTTQVEYLLQIVHNKKWAH